MNEVERQILDMYAKDCSVGEISYTLLGKMLDEKFVKERLELFQKEEFYLYAGTYMAVQLYRIGKKYISIKGIVDKKGNIPLKEDAPVLTLDELRKQYNGENLIITSVRYYTEIKEELMEFIDEKKIYYIGELMQGISDHIIE